MRRLRLPLLRAFHFGVLAFSLVVFLADIKPLRIRMFRDSDKAAHILIFIFLAYSACVFLSTFSRICNKKTFYIIPITAFFWCFGLGYMIELFQELYTKHRTFDWRDVGADTIGVAAGCLFWIFIRRKLRANFPSRG